MTADVVDETTLFLIGKWNGKHHIQDYGNTLCGKSIDGMEQERWLGAEGGPRQRTVADERVNKGHLVNVCDRCLRKAGVNPYKAGA